MKQRIITTDQEYYQLREDWDRLHLKINGSIFQSFDWNGEWWRLYKDGLELCIFTVWLDDSLVGVLPLFRERVNLGLWRIKRLKFLGTYEIYGEYGPLILPDVEKEVISQMASFCAEEVKSGRSDIIEFFRFPQTSRAMKMFFQAVGNHSVDMKYLPFCMPRMTMELPNTWDSYIRSLTPNEQEMLSRRMRSLQKHGAELEILVEKEDIVPAFHDFVRLHTISWKERGDGGYFITFKHFRDFHKDITAQLAEKNVGRLYFFKKDGLRFAAVQAFFINGQCCFYLSGLDRHHALAKYSPGKVLLSFVIKDAIKENYKIFDFQGGKEDYKFRLGGKLTSFSKATIWKKGKGSHKLFIFFLVQMLRRNLRDISADERISTVKKRFFSFFRN